jgi:hypothetical protein
MSSGHAKFRWCTSRNGDGGDGSTAGILSLEGEDRVADFSVREIHRNDNNQPDSGEN